jgi:hypothetical protein
MHGTPVEELACGTGSSRCQQHTPAVVWNGGMACHRGASAWEKPAWPSCATAVSMLCHALGASTRTGSTLSALCSWLSCRIVAISLPKPLTTSCGFAAAAEDNVGQSNPHQASNPPGLCLQGAFPPVRKVLAPPSENEAWHSAGLLRHLHRPGACQTQ